MFVKICGITTVDDALLAAGMGADAIGMIFAASPRQVTPAQAGAILEQVPDEVLTVGVFRDHPIDEVIATATGLGLRAVQLHGAETPDDVARVAARIPRVIKVFPAGAPELADAGRYRARLMIDSPSPGSGMVFDWAVLDGTPLRRRFILAGGLDPDNVVEAIHTVRPWGVDLASGVEAAPGRKDGDKLRRFMAAVRAQPDPDPPDHWDTPDNWEENPT
ncbi:MAG: phosphoribosylanthranilate isomerase [Acidimicrobiales bacterium]